MRSLQEEEILFDGFFPISIANLGNGTTEADLSTVMSGIALSLPLYPHLISRPSSYSVTQLARPAPRRNSQELTRISASSL